MRGRILDSRCCVLNTEVESIDLHRGFARFAGHGTKPLEIVRPTVPGRSGTSNYRGSDYNRRVILHVIRRNAPVSRSDIALVTGLTRAGVVTITKRLLKDGLILETGRIRRNRGAPAVRLGINPNGRFSIGLNVGCDHITVVVLDFLGNARARSSREIAFAQPEAVLRYFRRSVGPMLAKAGIERGQLAGVGIALPTKTALTQLSGQPADYGVWNTVRIDDLIRNTLDIPVYVQSEAAAAAMGEMQFGLGHQYGSFFYILVAATLGGGLVVDGQHIVGASGRSGEFGCFPSGAPESQTPHLHRILSLSALYCRLSEGGFRVASPLGLTRLGPRARDLIDLWISDSAEALMSSLLAINCLINPEAILVGGRLPPMLIDRLAATLNERIAGLRLQWPGLAPILRATLSDDAAAVGAAILAFSEQLLPKRYPLLKAL